MNEKYINFKQQIKLNSNICGISSDEVSFAKSLVNNKTKDKNLFVCEGLWACDKLIEKGIKVKQFFYNNDRLETNDLTEDELEKIAKMTKYSEKSYAISEKSCKKISDRDGFDEFFIIAEMQNITFDWKHWCDIEII